VLDLGGCGSQQDVRDQLAALLGRRTGVARVTLAGELDPRVDLDIPSLLDVPHELEGLQLRLGQLLPTYNLEDVAGEPTVRGQFVRDVLSADLDEEERQRVLLVGLRALEGQAALDPLG
jgi:DNA repair protein SbcD/Mre11